MTSQFPKMGDMPLVGNVVNVSGRGSRYTQTVPRKGPANDKDPSIGTAAHRGQTMIHEAHGPTFRPMTTIDYPNAPERKGTGRGMRTVPSSVGNRDFWTDRSVSQSGKVI